MAVSVSPAVTRTAVNTPPYATSVKGKFPLFSSLQFPKELRILNTRSKSLKCETRPRRLTLVASKEEIFASFDELLERSDKPVFVDFYATWCGPCQFMVPVLEEVSSLMKDKIQVVKIDTEKYPTIANEYKIEALPTFILFVDGKPCDRFEGAMAAEKLIERIETSLQVKQ
ncbi:uncharacterized protein LOC142545907 [Primulina tabacum]|uniref:uncharacterized protein LOC142545907 n=1 Tax=Primulina tabacum TaxID=48773 RepID=UPI003F5A55FE